MSMHSLPAGETSRISIDHPKEFKLNSIHTVAILIYCRVLSNLVLPVMLLKYLLMKSHGTLSSLVVTSSLLKLQWMPHWARPISMHYWTSFLVSKWGRPSWPWRMKMICTRHMRTLQRNWHWYATSTFGSLWKSQSLPSTRMKNIPTIFTHDQFGSGHLTCCRIPNSHLTSCGMHSASTNMMVKNMSTFLESLGLVTVGGIFKFIHLYHDNLCVFNMYILHVLATYWQCVHGCGWDHYW